MLVSPFACHVTVSDNTQLKNQKDPNFFKKMAVSANPVLVQLEQSSPPEQTTQKIAETNQFGYYHYHGPSGTMELTISAIAQKIKDDQYAHHLVWQQGFENWRPALQVSAIQQAVQQLITEQV